MPNRQYNTEFDGGFIGFDSRTNPALLKPQMLQYAENVRIFRGEVVKRKGIERIDDEAFLDGQGQQRAIKASCQYVTQDGVEKIALFCNTALVLYTPTTDSYQVFDYPEGRIAEADDKCMALQALDRLYLFRGMPEEKKECTLDNSTHPHTTVTVNCINHGYALGDEIIVSDVDPANPIEDELTVATVITNVVSNDVFEYQIEPTPNGHQNRDAIVQRAKPALVWDGSVISVVPQGNTIGISANMPPSDTALYYNNRIIVKTDRNSIAASDFLDFDTFDLTFGQFTINQGANDYIVGITPWSQDEFLVFQRNTIFIGRVVNSAYEIGEGASDNSYLMTLTSSFGAVARRTIINTGRLVFFLTDTGVFALEPQLDLKLINTLEPISSPIDNYIENIRKDLVADAVGVYFDNRIFLAIPVGPEATGNNVVLIYNLLNKAWESVDSFYAGFLVDDFVVCQKGDRKRLFVTCKQPNALNTAIISGLSLYEENELGDENAQSGRPKLPVPFELLAGVDGEGVDVPSPEPQRFISIQNSEEAQNRHVVTMLPEFDASGYPAAFPQKHGYTVGDTVRIHDNEWRETYRNIKGYEWMDENYNLLYVYNVKVKEVIDEYSFVYEKDYPFPDDGFLRKWIYNQEEYENTGSFGIYSYDFPIVDRVKIAGVYGFIMDEGLKSFFSIPAYIITRKMTFGTAQEKRFSAVSVDAVFKTAGEFKTTVNIYNPDQSSIVDLAYSSKPNDVTRKVGVARRGYAAEVRIDTTSGRPVIRAISVDATFASRNNRSTE